MDSKTTTVKISRETKTRLDNLKEYNRESYEEILKKILHILNLVRKNPLLAERFLGDIDKTIKRRDAREKTTL